MREKITNIVDLKKHIENNNFDEYIIEVDQKIKLSFPIAKIYLAPDLLYLGNKDNIICLEIDGMEGNDDIIVLHVRYNGGKYNIAFSCCQYN